MTRPEMSEIEPVLDRFVQWARALGWRYDMAPSYLRQLMRFLHARGVQSLDQVDAAMLLEHQRRLLLSRSPAAVECHTSCLRALWRYLLREGLVREDVARTLPQLRRDPFAPHLYSKDELVRIERAAREAVASARTPALRLGRDGRHMAFTLLIDCGLRVSEACRLDLAHYDPKERTLRIERTKFFKTRVIPLPRSTSTRLDRYLERRMRAGPGCAALLLSTAGTRLLRKGLEASFQDLLSERRLYRPRRKRGRTVFGSTNLHALRHTFAVRTLERWQRAGGDVDALLPLLSAYMGHAHVSYTTTYLHLTPLLRELASRRFGDEVLPQLDGVRARKRDPDAQA